MNDDGRSAAAGATIHVNHFCDVTGCGKRGGFGFASAASVEMRWWYRETDVPIEAEFSSS